METWVDKELLSKDVMIGTVAMATCRKNMRATHGFH
jgi:hypothetical protein